MYTLIHKMIESQTYISVVDLDANELGNIFVL